jgi:hypothetical protein
MVGCANIFDVQSTAQDCLVSKSAAADKMFSSLVAEMNEATKIERQVHGTIPEKVPSWL